MDGAEWVTVAKGMYLSQDRRMADIGFRCARDRK